MAAALKRQRNAGILRRARTPPPVHLNCDRRRIVWPIRNSPEIWNMRLVLAVATASRKTAGTEKRRSTEQRNTDTMGVAATRDSTSDWRKVGAQVTGHLTIFQTRTRGPWWSTRPAWILLAVVCGTQAVATLIAVYGAGLVTPLGWTYAGLVWGYAFAWFLVTDPVKLLAYMVFDTAKTGAQPAAEKPEMAAEAAANTHAKVSPKLAAETELPAAPHAAAQAGMATLVGTKLRDIIVAAVLQDPEAAGRLVERAITRAETQDAGANLPEPKAEPVPGAEAGARAKSKPETEADQPANEPKKPGTKAEPITAKAAAAPHADPNAAMTALVGTPLGDIILAALLKDPHAAGTLISQTITQSKSSEAGAKPRETKAASMPDAKTGIPVTPLQHAAE